MKSCFGYVRVSTQKQGEGVSLEAQREAIERFATQNQLTINNWFEEKETAAKSGRPVFNGMIKDLHRGKATGLIMHKIDRSARNFADWAKIGELSDAGIDVHFATESLDFRTRGGRLSADIQAVIAADYIRNLREETIKGITGRLKQGLYPFKAPIGYCDNGGGKPKTIDPVRGPMVRQAFELYDSGQHSIRSLVIELKERGLRNEAGRPYSKCCIENMLQNPFYCGLMRLKHSGAVYRGIHEPLISASLFERVQERKAGRAVKKATRHNYTYRGQFRCAHCHTAMTPERQKGHVYYRCHTPDCSTKCVRESAIEAAISEMLWSTKLTDENIGWLTEQVRQWIEKRSVSNEQKSIAMQLANIDDRIERLTDALIDRLITKEEYDKRHKNLLLEKLRLEEHAADADKHTDIGHNVRQFLELIKSLAQTYLSADPAEKRKITEIATSNRIVSGKNIQLQRSNWLLTTQKAISVLSCCPVRTTSRRRTQLQDQQLTEFIELINSNDVAKNMKKLDKMTDPTDDSDSIESTRVMIDSADG